MSRTDSSKSITESRVQLQDIQQEKLLRVSIEATPATVHMVQASYQQAHREIDSTYHFSLEPASLARVGACSAMQPFNVADGFPKAEGRLLYWW